MTGGFKIMAVVSWIGMVVLGIALYVVYWELRTYISQVAHVVLRLEQTQKDEYEMLVCSLTNLEGRVQNAVQTVWRSK